MLHLYCINNGWHACDAATSDAKPGLSSSCCALLKKLVQANHPSWQAHHPDPLVIRSLAAALE
jgi:hypothetical protein